MAGEQRPAAPKNAGARATGARAAGTRGADARAAGTRTGTGIPKRPAEKPATGIRKGTGGASSRASGTRTPGHSVVAALLADSVGDSIGDPIADRIGNSMGDSTGNSTGRTTPRPGGATRRTDPAARRYESSGSRIGHSAAASPEPAVAPAIEDIALGAASVLAEQLWRLGSRGAGLATHALGQLAALIRGVSPNYATTWADAQLRSLADRGQRIRHERSEAVGSTMTAAMTAAVTSEAMREMTVTAVEQATDDVLAVVLPAMLDAIDDRETQQRLDELMAGLLLRQLPDALEKTLPGVMVRTATRTSLGLVPSLMGALTSGRTGESGQSSGPSQARS